MKLASREVHFILYTGPPVCQAPPERIFFLVQKVGGEDTRPLRRSGCGKSPVPGGLFPQPCIPLLFRPARAEKSSLCSPPPLLCKGGGGYDLTRGGLPPPRAPPPDPEPSFSEKEGPTSWPTEYMHLFTIDLCPLRRNLPVFNIFFRSCGPFGRMAVVPSKGSGLSTRLRESRPPGTG